NSLTHPNNTTFGIKALQQKPDQNKEFRSDIKRSMRSRCSHPLSSSQTPTHDPPCAPADTTPPPDPHTSRGTGTRQPVRTARRTRGTTRENTTGPPPHTGTEGRACSLRTQQSADTPSRRTPAHRSSKTGWQTRA